MNKSLRFIIILLILTQYSMQLFSQSIEEEFYIPIIKKLSDSLYNGIKGLNEEAFVMHKFTYKDLKIDISHYIPSTYTEEFYEKVSEFKLCIKHFDSCFCLNDGKSLELALRRGFHRYINNKPYDINLELEKYKNDCEKLSKKRQKEYIADTIDGHYIPKDIDEAVDVLIKMLPEERLASIKSLKEENVIGEEHMNLGHFIRNYWVLWGANRLTINIASKYGIFNADGVSGCILLFLHRKLNNKDLEIEKTIRNEKIEEDKMKKKE